MAVGATMIPDPSLARLDVHASRMRRSLLPKWTTIGLFCAGPHRPSLSLAPANSFAYRERGPSVSGLLGAETEVA